MADATQLHQIVMNLCTNSMHAIQERSGNAGRVGRIEVRVDHGETGVGIGLEAPGTLFPGRFVRLTVADDGIGMDDSTRARIFDPFFTTKPAGDGTGLGLSVVHGIVETHQGAITVASAPGSGTTFALYFPAVELRPSALLSSTPSDGTSRPTDPAGNLLRVLYVDDDQTIVSLVSRLLAKAGCRVAGFTRAQLALDAVRDSPSDFDVVVSDFNMPELSGLDIARGVFAVRPDMPVIITSGYITGELQREADHIGIHALLYKPDLARRLLHTVCAVQRPGT